MALGNQPGSLGINPNSRSKRRVDSLPGVLRLAQNVPIATTSFKAGIYAGSSTDKEKMLELVNLATGGGFTWVKNKLTFDSKFKPQGKYSKKFRNSFIKVMSGARSQITLHFAKQYKQYDESGKFVVMSLPPGEGVVGYNNKQGTGFNVIIWSDKKIESSMPAEYKKKLPSTLAAVLIHELNVHVFTTLSNDSRSSYDVMKETKSYLESGVGIPEMYTKHWGGPGMHTHDSKINKTKGKTWRVPF